MFESHDSREDYLEQDRAEKAKYARLLFHYRCVWCMWLLTVVALIVLASWRR
jgi:hypothetical protein